MAKEKKEQPEMDDVVDLAMILTNQVEDAGAKASAISESDDAMTAEVRIMTSDSIYLVTVKELANICSQFDPALRTRGEG
jgi:hypothetical protein